VIAPTTYGEVSDNGLAAPRPHQSASSGRGHPSRYAYSGRHQPFTLSSGPRQ
jgi:hypothetical protein